MTEPQAQIRVQIQTQAPQASLTPSLRRALFTSSSDGEIPWDAVMPAIVDVLFHDVRVEASEAQRLAGLVAERLAPTAFQPIHEAMAKAGSCDLRHEFADLQAAFVAKAVVAVLSHLDLVDPRRRHLRALLG